MSESTGKIAATPIEAEQPYEFRAQGVEHIAVPPEWSVQSLEQFQSQPERLRERIVLTSMESFLDYVQRFKRLDTTIIKTFDSSLRRAGDVFAEAIIDYHEADEENHHVASWCDHTAIFRPALDSGWETWLKNDCAPMSQAAFADFIYLNQADIVEPAGADLLAIIESLKATSRGEFQNSRDLHSGSVEAVFRMKVSATGGTQDKPVELPKQFSVTVQPIKGGPKADLKLDLILRAPKSDGERLALSYRIYRVDDVIGEVCEQAVELMNKELDLPVYRCEHG